jgi:hypothetical protein
MSEAEEEEGGENVAPIPYRPPDRKSEMKDVLKWLSFTEAERIPIMKELGYNLKSFLKITNRELEQLSKDMRHVKVTIGLERLKLLKGVIHWAKDKQRIGEEVMMMIDGSDVSSAQFDFLEELGEAIDRDSVKPTKDSIEARGNKASPGKLKDEKNWDKWEKGLKLMLSILRGVNGVPLSYVIREKDHEAGKLYGNFLDESVAKVKLSGASFQSDARTVHEIIETLTGGENAANWIKSLEEENDGRKDMIALRLHYRGAGNQSRRISNANALRLTLHYKNERAMKFSDFISKVKEMFDIYIDCGEPKHEPEMLRFLWEHIDCPVLHTPMEVIQAALTDNAHSWTFVQACDHLASKIVSTQKTVKFQAAAIDSGAKGTGGSNIMRNGKIFSGTYAQNEWFDVLTKDERSQVQAERKKDGKPRFDKKKKPQYERKIKALEKKLTKERKTISSMKRATKEKDTSDESDSESSTDGDNAGNSFGGRAEKQRQKKKKKKN